MTVERAATRGTGRALIAAGLVTLLVLGWQYVRREPERVAAVPQATPQAAPQPVPQAAVPVVPAGSVASVAVPLPVPLAVPAVPAVPGGAAPSFDVVRVSPQGSAVIAGRAEPGSRVVVFDGSTEIARVQADRQGSFVAIPAAPLGEGGRSLTLASRGAEGVETRGDGTVVVVVPPAPAPVPAPAPAAAVVAVPGPPVPLAVLVPSAGPSRVLQGERAAAVGLDTVDYDDAGAIRFSGRAAAGGTVRVYVDNRAVGDVVADGSGRWVLSPEGAVAPGVHTLRLDRLDASGAVTARVEMPFQRAAVAAAELGAGRVVVQPGQNLWRLARAAYGSGVRYTVIFLANRDSIRDPRLIYPGQAFAVPGPR